MTTITRYLLIVALTAVGLHSCTKKHDKVLTKTQSYTSKLGGIRKWRIYKVGTPYYSYPARSYDTTADTFAIRIISDTTVVFDAKKFGYDEIMLYFISKDSSNGSMYFSSHLPTEPPYGAYVSELTYYMSNDSMHFDIESVGGSRLYSRADYYSQ